MFDLSFVELMTIGGIALVVLGPEKLPKAVRTVGTYYAKFRRTASTLKAEMEAELDLVETRQLMEKELAKIKEAEAQMQKEMAQLRGNMKQFEKEQEKALKSATDTPQVEPQAADRDKTTVSASSSDLSTSHSATADPMNTDVGIIDNQLPAPPTKPWENMWFLLGDYDRASRLPAAPFMPNYEPMPLLNVAIESTSPLSSTIDLPPTVDTVSLNKEVEAVDTDISLSSKNHLHAQTLPSAPGAL